MDYFSILLVVTIVLLASSKRSLEPVLSGMIVMLLFSICGLQLVVAFICAFCAFLLAVMMQSTVRGTVTLSVMYSAMYTLIVYTVVRGSIPPEIFDSFLKAAVCAAAFVACLLLHGHNDAPAS